jgi:hypothetical protein
MKLARYALPLACLLLAISMALAVMVSYPSQHVLAQGPYARCEQTATTVTSLVATSGTTATQVVALVASTPIYVCGMTVVGTSGTTPTFSLVYGTGVNCGTGQHVFLPAVSTTANVPLVWPGFVGTVPAGNALCYLDGGTTPVQGVILVTAQG